jgi:hypothetical protein
MPRRSRFLGGEVGNARLTSLAGAILIVLLAVEGATIPWMSSLVSVHIFVGMLLLGPVALKLATTGYRFLRYYTNSAPYVSQGPPAPLMRVLVAPVLAVSTLTLFGSGVALLAVPHRGALAGLHKASFVVWLAAMAIHVLAYTSRAAQRSLADLTGPRIGGERVRLLAVGLVLVAGLATAIATYPLAAPWLGHLTR